MGWFDSMCPACNGKKTVYDDGSFNRQKWCHVCRGTGSVKSAIKKKYTADCPCCHAVGSITSRTANHEYWPDGGIKKEQWITKSRTCGECNGRRRVENPFTLVISEDGTKYVIAGNGEIATINDHDYDKYNR